jgi:uncharacterized protein YndB with AHSA1/START domain
VSASTPSSRRDVRGSIVVEQEVDATAEHAMNAWLTPEALAAWWWPHITDTTYDMDARPGGSYAIRSEAAGIGVEGEVVSIDRPRDLRLTWRWLNEGVAQVEEPVIVTFDPHGGGTRVVVTHTLHDLAAEGDGIREGWESVLGRLAAHLARRP